MLVLLFAGCASSSEEEKVVQPKEKPVLRLYVYAPDRPIVTRADIGDVAATTAENAVHSLHVWVFETGTDDLVGHVQLTNPAMADQLDANNSSIVGQTVTVPISDAFATKLENSTAPYVDVYVAANVTPANCGLSLDGATTRTKLKEALIEHKTAADYFGVTALASLPSAVMDVPEGGLPMSGLLENQTVTGTSPVYAVTPRVKLVRAVSKVRFIFTKASSVADDESLKVSAITLDDGVLPKQEYLLLEAPYTTDGRQSHVVSTGVSPYEAEATLVGEVGGSAINACGTPTDYIYNVEDGAQAYETQINGGLVTQEGHTAPDLSELGRLYLRESDKKLTGKIRYTTESSEKTATFEMAEAGDFSRNHTWIVYAYFGGSGLLKVNVVNVKNWDADQGSHAVYNW